MTFIHFCWFGYRKNSPMKNNWANRMVNRAVLWSHPLRIWTNTYLEFPLLLVWYVFQFDAGKFWNDCRIGRQQLHTATANRRTVVAWMERREKKSKREYRSLKMLHMHSIYEHVIIFSTKRWNSKCCHAVLAYKISQCKYFYVILRLDLFLAWTDFIIVFWFEKTISKWIIIERSDKMVLSDKISWAQI